MEIVRMMKRFKRCDTPLIFTFVCLALIIFPIIYIFFGIFNQTNESTEFLFKTQLKFYIKNSFIILFFTGIFTGIIGTFLAYFETFYEYKFKNFFKFTLILPFAIPSYLFGYIYVDFFSYSGWLVTFLRQNFDIRVHFDIMNIYGAIFVLTLAFYPYVYIILRGFLKRFPQNYIEASQNLGCTQVKTFFKVILPLSKPAIISGMTLCLMECLNAYGVPNYFGLHVFSTGIYKAWVGYSDLNAAIKLASILLFLVFFIIIVQKLLQKPYAITVTKRQKIRAKKLSKKSEIAVVCLIFLFLFVALFLPLLHIFIWLYQSYSDINLISLFNLSKNTILLTTLSAMLIVVFSLFINESLRLKEGKIKEIATSFANIGYSIPGSVVGISMLAIFINIDKSMQWLYRLLEVKATLFLTLSPLVLVFAYMIRFLSLGYMGVQNSLNQQGKKYYEASLSLGKGKLKTFFLVDLPMIKPAILSSFILVFIEIIKELPLSSLLTPPNLKTLAFEMDRYASDEQLALSAAPAIVVVGISLALLVILNKIKDK
ncbi:iron ABC transporter permease [Campylobacter ureolyticus]|uniref:ABC transporter permease n=1 Tax=Campylobacter ureolyticus TaxID=827 RepID=UPI0022B4D587|nr:iron ABC transporter permease [Campylobacter ureolyticus]MCZ6156614.1 iron ABC transporter permease [Campylobacter ureolyticus]